MIVVLGAQPASHDALLGRASVEHDLDHGVELHLFLLHSLPEGFGLGEIAGKSIQQPALCAIRFFQTGEDHGDRDIVGHQFTAVDVGLRLFPEVRAALDVVPEDNAGFDVRHPVLLLNHGALRSLATPVRSEYEDVHAASLLSRQCFIQKNCLLIMD